MADVREAERAMGTGPHRGIREDVIAEAGITFDPPGVEQRAGGDPQGRIQVVTDEASTRTGRKPPNTRKRRGVFIVPRVRAIDAIDGRNGREPPFPWDPSFRKAIISRT